MSRAILGRLDRRFGGALQTALAIFDGTYERPFFHALLASQLDMDRLDYLRRDSFYTGVAEGVVGVERILKTLRVHGRGADARLVIEAKGGYAVENALLSRRLMYWQVYLHKTVLAADHVLRNAFARARENWASGDPALAATAPALAPFMSGRHHRRRLRRPRRRRARGARRLLRTGRRGRPRLAQAVARSEDRVLADLSRRFLDRDLFRTTFLPEPASEDDLGLWRDQVAHWLVARGLSSPEAAADDARYYLVAATSKHDAYQTQHDSISILERDGRLRELSLASDAGAVDALSTPVVKPYLVAPKDADLHIVPA